MIVYLMGCTCAGKGTFIDFVQAQQAKHIGFVQVGKMFRAKYPPEYFKGQAAPAHTQKEATDMCLQGIKDNIDAGKEIVIVDGQPRSDDQVLITQVWKKTLGPKFQCRYEMLDCSLDERKRRLEGRFTGTDSASFDLGAKRLENDMKTYYTVLMTLLRNRVMFSVRDTQEDGWMDKLYHVIR